jgi:hypothetical protein
MIVVHRVTLSLPHCLPGKVRAIGVSNFSIKNLEILLPKVNVVPAVNQVRYIAPISLGGVSYTPDRLRFTLVCLIQSLSNTASLRILWSRDTPLWAGLKPPFTLARSLRLLRKSIR